MAFDVSVYMSGVLILLSHWHHHETQDSPGTLHIQSVADLHSKSPMSNSSMPREWSDAFKSDGGAFQPLSAEARRFPEEVAVDERVLRRVGMLTQQFKEATCIPQSLDERVRDVYKSMQLHSDSIAMSQTQVRCTDWRKRWIVCLKFVLFLDCGSTWHAWSPFSNLFKSTDKYVFSVSRDSHASLNSIHIPPSPDRVHRLQLLSYKAMGIRDS